MKCVLITDCIEPESDVVVNVAAIEYVCVTADEGVVCLTSGTVIRTTAAQAANVQKVLIRNSEI